MNGFKRKSIQRLEEIGATLLILTVVLYPGLPPIRLFNFDFFAIYVPVIALILATIGILTIKKELAYETALFSLLTFFLYVCGFLLTIQSYTINPREVFTYFVSGSVVFILAVYTNRSEQVRRIIYVLFGITAVLLIIAGWELITGSHLSASRLSTSSHSGQYASTIFYNRNNFGFFLAMIAPLLMYNILSRNMFDGIWNTSVIAIICQFIILYINSSRSATLSYILGVVIVTVGWYLRETKTSMRRWPRVGLIAYFTSSLSFIIVPHVISNPLGQQAYSSVHVRWKLMEGGAKYIPFHPLEPAGLGMFGAAVPIAGAKEIPATAHNWAIQLGVETGVLGLLLFIVAVGNITDKLFISYYERESDWALPIATSLLLFPINGLGPSNVLLQSRIFWIIVGLGASILIMSD